MRFIWEHNGDDTLLYSEECIGAFTRGTNLEEAIEKIPDEINSYLNWGKKPTLENITVEIIQEKNSNLQIKDADSNVIFDSETSPLSIEEYLQLKKMDLQSALEFYKLYLSVPDKKESCLPITSEKSELTRTTRERYTSAAKEALNF